MVGRLNASSLSLLPEEIMMHPNSGSNGRANLPTTSAIARIWLTVALIIGSTLLLVTPAKAGGQIFAEIWLYNNTTYAFLIPFSGAQTPQLWGTYGNTLDSADGAVERLRAE